MTIAEHPPAHRAEDAVSERAHPLAVRPFVGNRTDSAVGLDPVKRWIGTRCYSVHGMPHSRLVEKGPPASLRSISSLQRIGKYPSARQFSRAPRIGPFLNSLEAEF